MCVYVCKGDGNRDSTAQHSLSFLPVSHQMAPWLDAHTHTTPFSVSYSLPLQIQCHPHMPPLQKINCEKRAAPDSSPCSSSRCNLWQPLGDKKQEQMWHEAAGRCQRRPEQVATSSSNPSTHTITHTYTHRHTHLAPHFQNRILTVTVREIHRQWSLLFLLSP